MKSPRWVIPRVAIEMGGLALAVLTIFVGWRRHRGHEELPCALPSKDEPTSIVGRAIARSALHERALVLYVLMLLVAVIYGAGEDRPLALALVGADLAVLAGGIVVLRAPLIENRFASSLLARLIVLGTLLVTFLQLDVVLPAARAETMDSTLFAIDMQLFGIEPAIVFDRWVKPATTEWFAFFYFGYFLILAVHVVPFMLFERRLRLVGEFALGMIAVYCIGHITYLLVPGFGPYRSLSFVHRLEGDTWWPLVQSGAVAINEGARTDIFPSLHTAGPVFIALFSFRHRALRPFRYSWPIVAVCSTQIMLATMFLRWHYLIDVVAGLVLAIAADTLARLASLEAEHRRDGLIPPVWAPLRLTDLTSPRSEDVD